MDAKLMRLRLRSSTRRGSGLSHQVGLVLIIPLDGTNGDNILEWGYPLGNPLGQRLYYSETKKSIEPAALIFSASF